MICQCNWVGLGPCPCLQRANKIQYAMINKPVEDQTVAIGGSAGPKARQGWQCPVCSKVHAPWVPACACSG